MALAIPNRHPIAAEAKNIRKNRETTKEAISKKLKLESDKVVIVL